MLGRSERARNEPAPALGPWMIWTARLARPTRAPCRTRDRPIAPGAIQIQGEILPVRGATCVACRSGLGGGSPLPLSPAWPTRSDLSSRPHPDYRPPQPNAHLTIFPSPVSHVPPCTPHPP